MSIMYDSPSGEPEWVEIYNRSDQTYNLAGMANCGCSWVCCYNK
ncbi:MAG: hypothetical protein U5K00_01635 [Melioribacteraceae bacterium]|nr:hypothetical protein [Melioribacteraceae bacterium]